MQRDAGWRVRVGFALAAGMAGTLLASELLRAEDPEIRLGIDGLVKEGCAFPVTIGPVPGAERCTLRLMTRSSWRDKKPTCTGVFEAMPDEQTGGWQALARVGESAIRYSCDDYGSRPFLRCEFALSDGRTTTFDAPLDVLDGSALLALTLTDRPQDFEFLGGFVSTQSDSVRGLVQTNLHALPPTWTAMEAVGLLVLDGGPPPTPEQAACVRDWVAQGGTVLLTPRGLTHARGWDFIPGVPLPTGRRQAAGGDLAWLLGSHTNLVESVQVVDASLPGFLTLMPGPTGAFVSGRDFGNGRLLALGVDWQSFTLRDPTLYETVRRVLWSRVLDLRQPPSRRSFDRQAAIPREAQVRFLLGPLIGFMALCFLLLGPLNALILRRLRRLELAAITLPLGAVLLAALAFAGGLAMRTRDVVVVDREAMVSTQGAALACGLSGVLAPEGRTFTLGVADPRAELLERGSGYDSYESSDVSLRWITTPAGPYLANVSIPRWAMRFFSTWRPAPEEPPLAGADVVSTNLLRGSVVNRSSHTLHDACVVYLWDRVTLGDLPPGATRAFDLTLTPYASAIGGGICSGCHRIHGMRDPLASRPDQPDVSQTLQDLVDDSPLSVSGTDGPWLVAWHTNSLSVVEVDGTTPVQRDARRLVAAQVALTWPSPVTIPESFIQSFNIGMTSESDDRPDDTLRVEIKGCELAEVPCRLAGYELQRALPALRVPESKSRRSRMMEPPTDSVPRNRFWYRLPPDAGAPGPGTALTVNWDMGTQDPDQEDPRHEAALSVFNWHTSEWMELGRATTNAHAFCLPAAPYVFSSPPMLVFEMKSTASLDPEKPWRNVVYPDHLGVSLATREEQP